jgi:hypothetical protein
MKFGPLHNTAREITHNLPFCASLLKRKKPTLLRAGAALPSILLLKGQQTCLQDEYTVYLNRAVGSWHWQIGRLKQSRHKEKTPSHKRAKRIENEKLKDACSNHKSDQHQVREPNTKRRLSHTYTPIFHTHSISLCMIFECQQLLEVNDPLVNEKNDAPKYS